MTNANNRRKLTSAQKDRAAGVLYATAAGDALGAPYEFGPPLAPGTPVLMKGGGSFGWGVGEWTDDTSMALPIAWAALRGADLRKADVQDRIVASWVAWAAVTTDVGNQTRIVLGDIEADPSAAAAVEAAARLHRRTGRTAGNGSLMRTAPVALAFLHDKDALVEAATAISALTHHDPEAGEACVLWCLAIRHAVLDGEFDLRAGLRRLPADRVRVWSDRIAEAEENPPASFDKNGWVVHALQAAWSAISRTPVPANQPARHLQLALEEAVRGGRDTDTVAAIAGGLLGARWGASAVPLAWQRVLHGWPFDRDAMTGERPPARRRLSAAPAPRRHGADPVPRISWDWPRSSCPGRIPRRGSGPASTGWTTGRSATTTATRSSRIRSTRACGWRGSMR
jgi:ADP-ribosyl-[dinitrogen reductase] hydrolase